MKHLLSALMISGVALAAAPVAADEHPVVVELFTSAGCSSCPPADAMLAELAGRDRILALALHVDYWDYIGWKDEFGDPQYSERQRRYARVAHVRHGTPEFVIGGTGHVLGANAMKVLDQIAAAASQPAQVELELGRRSGAVTISADLVGGPRRDMVVQLVRYKPAATVSITRGENAGRTIDYANIVTEWHAIREWNGAAPLRLTARVQGSEPVVVIVQEAGPGAILAAAELR